MERTPYGTPAPVKRVFENYYVELVNTLAQYLSDVLLYLVPEGVIKIEEKNTIKSYRDTPTDKAEYLLDNHVNRQLSEGITDNFMKLLKVMRKIPGCNPLAVELSKALKWDTDEPNIPVVSNARSTEEVSKNIQTGMEYHNNNMGIHRDYAKPRPLNHRHFE